MPQSQVKYFGLDVFGAGRVDGFSQLLHQKVDELRPGSLEIFAERLGAYGRSQHLTEFRGDEIEHRDTGLAHGAAEAPAYALLSAAIKTGSRLAIWLSTRI